MTINPEIMAALLASGRPFEITPEGGLIVDAAPLPDTRSRKARNQAAYRARKAVTNGNASATDGNEVADVETPVTQPSPSSPFPTPLSSPPPPAPSPRAREEGQFSLSSEEKPKSSKLFSPPSIEAWTAFGSTLTPPFPELDAANTWNHYQSKGWKVGNQPMKDWQAACRTCHGRWIKEGNHTSPHAPRSRKTSDQRSDSSNRPGRYG